MLRSIIQTENGTYRDGKLRFERIHFPPYQQNITGRQYDEVHDKGIKFHQSSDKVYYAYN